MPEEEIAKNLIKEAKTPLAAPSANISGKPSGTNIKDIFNELNNKANSEYQEYLYQKGKEEVKDTIEDSITMEEYSDILDVNSSNDVEINGNKVKAADLMEVIFELFVKE